MLVATFTKKEEKVTSNYKMLIIRLLQDKKNDLDI